ncbi:UNKNOWN [Stylonychia lemnae]|uniref:Uncharacterized protein n=1 Tax=Stylonychia lemnae TaxID=5949 RepID=A0A078AP57_STYLE|nr:UNKNOWN [Stylonychia lemnae]|eukprot:CDW84165.1 UNKNOWN [Stylonychia lemnae]
MFSIRFVFLFLAISLPELIYATPACFNIRGSPIYIGKKDEASSKISLIEQNLDKNYLGIAGTFNSQQMIGLYSHDSNLN